MAKTERPTVVRTQSGFRCGSVDVDQVASGADGSVVIGLHTGRCAPVRAHVSADGQSIEVWQGDQRLDDMEEMARVQEVADYAKQRIDDAITVLDRHRHCDVGRACACLARVLAVLCGPHMEA